MSARPPYSEDNNFDSRSDAICFVNYALGDRIIVNTDDDDDARIAMILHTFLL